MKNWTQPELELVAEMHLSGNTHAEIACNIGTTKDAVTGAIRRLRAAGTLGDGPPKKKVIAAESKEAYWKAQAAVLSRELSEARKVATGMDVLVDMAHEFAPKSYQPAPYVRVKRARSKSSPQSAVLMFSDTHCGQTIDPGQTLNFGDYGFPQFLKRLRRLETGIISITKDHTTTYVDKLVVAMLGDMIHGNLSHATEAGQTATLFTQFYNAGHAIAQFLRNLAPLFPVMEIETAVGNHPRWGTQHKMPTDNRYSNLDNFLYAFTAALTRDIPNIKWNLSRQPFALFEVQGFVFYAGHGDTLRGGDRALGIPNHAIARQVSTTSQLFSKAGRKAPNYYLTGHLHRPITLPHAQGEFIVNGGFPGMDGYGLANNFNPCAPSQKFFFMHQKFGRAACYDLILDGFKGMPEPQPYSVPFPIK